MQIPNITNTVTSGVNYFLESSWKGKTVQVLSVALSLALIYFVAFRKRTPPPQGPDTPPLRPTGGAQTPPPGKEASTGAGVSSNSGAKGVQKTTEPPKADCSDIQTQDDPDFIKLPESEFGKWLFFKRKDFSEWCTWASSGVKHQEGFCYQALKKFIPELKIQVEKMIPVFEAHGVKRQDGGVFLEECNAAVIGQKTNLLDFCIKIKGYLDTLQSWDTALHSQKKERLKEMLKAVPHYDFINRTQYFHYLGLKTKGDFTRLLDTTNIACFETFGLKEMEDLDCLQLRAMLPSIERLRQLLCSLTVNGDERTHSQIPQEQEGLSLSQPHSKVEECVSEEPLHCQIEKEIKHCREVLRISDNLSDKLSYGDYSQRLRASVKLLRELFDELSKNFADGLDILKEIEKNDIARQLILLKGYITQYDVKAKWKQLNEMGILGLAQYADIYKPNTFYQMGD